MLRKGRQLSVFLVILMVCISIISMSGIVLAGQSNIDQKKAALDIVSKKSGENKLEIVDSAETKFPLSSKTVTTYKMTGGKDEVYKVTVDESGKEVDIEELMRAELTAQNKKYGKLDPYLAEKISTASKNEEIGVIIWVKERPGSDKQVAKEGSGVLSADEKTADEASAKQQIDEKVVTAVEKAGKERIADVNTAVAPVSDKMKNKGLKIEMDPYAPVIYAKLTTAQIREISKLEDVDIVYLNGKAENAINIARPTTNAHIVYNRNIAGWGVKVGEIEVGGGINPTNPYLAPPLERDTLNTCLENHAATVAGIIRSWNPTYFGTAPGAWLRIGGSCNGNINELVGPGSASSRAIGWGARILTNSWQNLNVDGNRKFEDRYFDSIMFNSPYVLPVIAAGNMGNINGRVTSPGLSYNGITVGAFDDMNTVSWTGDVMASYSGYINPNNGMEKPEVAAPGSNFISTVNNAPYIANVGSGTSYATPIVAAEAADLINRNSFLTYNPEATKAVIMASAVHNIEGSARLSGKDGAGGIVMDRADNIARGVNGNLGELTYTCNSPSPITLTTMSLIAGVPTRAVMTFSSNPNYIHDAFNPSADLDIRVYGPSGNLVASSLSIDNTYEIVSFTPSVTGNYQLRMNRFSCSSVNWVGWAWYRGT